MNKFLELKILKMLQEYENKLNDWHFDDNSESYSYYKGCYDVLYRLRGFIRNDNK